MTPREGFGIVVRAIGLIVALYGIALLIYPIVRTFGIAVDAKSSIAAEAIIGITYTAVGCALMFRAAFLVRMAYGSDENSD